MSPTRDTETNTSNILPTQGTFSHAPKRHPKNRQPREQVPRAGDDIFSGNYWKFWVTCGDYAKCSHLPNSPLPLPASHSRDSSRKKKRTKCKAKKIDDGGPPISLVSPTYVGAFPMNLNEHYGIRARVLHFHRPSDSSSCRSSSWTISAGATREVDGL